MKKTFKFLGMVMFTILMVTGFTSCSDDKKDDLNSIVGTWESTMGNETIAYNFKNNGTVISTYYYMGVKEEEEQYSYSVTGDLSSGATLRIWGMGDKGEFSDVYEARIEGKKLYLTSYGYTEVYTKK